MIQQKWSRYDLYNYKSIQYSKKNKKMVEGIIYYLLDIAIYNSSNIYYQNICKKVNSMQL